MDTYRYTIEETETGYRVREADGPNAPGTGEYATLEEAKSAVEHVAANHGIADLDWESGEDGDITGGKLVLIRWWLAEWDAEGKQ